MMWRLLMHHCFVDNNWWFFFYEHAETLKPQDTILILIFTTCSPPLMCLNNDTFLITHEFWIGAQSVTRSCNENKIQAERWESLSGCNNARQMLNGGTVNTKHLRGSNKEAMLTYYDSGRVLAATDRDLYVFLWAHWHADLYGVLWKWTPCSCTSRSLGDANQNVMPLSAVWQNRTLQHVQRENDFFFYHAYIFLFFGGQY